jgi:hypothetical protein
MIWRKHQNHEHKRRMHKFAPDIVVDVSKTAHRDQFAYLANERNKAAFVSLLMLYLKSAGHTVYQAEDDADT